MKHFPLAKLAAALTVVSSGAALAVPLDIATYDETDVNQTTLYVGGATAQDPGLERFMALNAANNGICVDGSLSIYRANLDANGDLPQRLYYCTGNANAGVNNGKRIALQKGSTGGSGNGVGPIARPSTITIPLWNVAALTAGGGFTCASSTLIPASGSFAEFTDNLGCTNATFTTSDTRPLEAGISDLEPNAFKGAFNPILSTAELGALNQASIAGTVFGIPVTKQVYKRMQAISFDPATSACNPNNAGYLGFGLGGLAQAQTIDMSLGCMPSLTDEQAAAIYSGNGGWTKWSNLKAPVSANLAAGTNLVNVAMPAGTPALIDAIEICRRSNTSGTQTTFQSFFLRQLATNSAGVADRCVTGGPSFRGISTNGGTIVQSSGGSPGVVACINGDNNDDVTAATPPGKDNTGAIVNYPIGSTVGTIGVLSLEFPPTASDEYAFVKLNGHPPCMLDIVRSDYDLFAESTMQYRNAAVGAAPALSANPNKLALANAIRTRLGQPATVQDINSGFLPIAACSARGTAVLAANAITNIAAAPVAPFVVGGGGTGDVTLHPVLTKSRFSGTANVCAPLREVSPTEMTF